MSVLLEFSIFPLDRGESVSSEVGRVIRMIRDSGYDYRLTAMGTIIETTTIHQALELVERSCQILDDQGCKRIYSSLKLDIRKGMTQRLTQKIDSITQKIGPLTE